MNRNLLRQLGVEWSRDCPPMILHYRLVRQVGMGGMGIVFEAIDTQLKRTVAIKFLKPKSLMSSTNEPVASIPDGLASCGPDEYTSRARERFVAEARAMAAINHPSVATIHSVEEQSQVPFLVMEYLIGESLDARLESCGNLEQRVVVDMAAQVADALDAAHGHGIVHRDVKPSNIWIEQDTERVKVLDFGLAEPIDPRGKSQFSGTPAYLSPEQAKSEPVDARADLYSLGVVMHRMLIGQLPFSAKTPAEMLVQIVAGRRSPIADKAKGMNPQLASIVDRLLQKEPANRFESARQLQAALTDVHNELNATWLRRAITFVCSGAFLQTAAMAVAPGLLVAVLLNRFQPTSIETLPVDQSSTALASIYNANEVNFSLGNVQTLQPASVDRTDQFVDLRFEGLPPSPQRIVDVALHFPSGFGQESAPIQCQITCEGVSGLVAEFSTDRFKYAGKLIAIPLAGIADLLNRNEAAELVLRLTLDEQPKLDWRDTSLRIEVVPGSGIDNRGSRDG